MADAEQFNVEADSGCFVCGVDNPAGLKAGFVIDREHGSATARLTLEPQYQGWKDVIHGGILATLLDEVAIYACRGRGEQFVTVEINVRFRKPVPVGSTIDLKGRIVEHKRKLFSVESSIEIDGVLYAEATARIIRLDI